MDDQRDHTEEAFNQHVANTGDGEVDVHDNGEDEYVLIHDVIGQWIDVKLYLNRAIVSVVLCNNDTPIGPSAEIQLEDLENALNYLKKRG